MSINRAQRRRSDKTGTAPTRTSWTRLAIASGTLLLVAAVAAIAIYNRKEIPQSASDAPIFAAIKVGATAPPFSVTTIDGRPIDSNAVHGPMLLEVFATWCPHCQHETALLNALQQQIGNKITIVAVSGSDTAADRASAESLEDVRGFAQYFHVVYPIAYDRNLAVAKEYLQGGFPTMVFITPAKRVAAVETGEVPPKRLMADAKKAGATP